MSVRPRSATPFSCGVFAEENDLLMCSFLQISSHCPAFDWGASSVRMILGGPYSLVSAKNWSSASGDSGFFLMQYIHDILVASSRKIIEYFLPPSDATGFSPLSSTKILTIFLSDRHSVVLFKRALSPFAAEHPTHGSSLVFGSSFTPCCSAFALSKRGCVWEVVRW